MPDMALREDHVDAALSVDELIEVVPALAVGRKVVTDAHATSPNALSKTRAPVSTARGR